MTLEARRVARRFHGAVVLRDDPTTEFSFSDGGKVAVVDAHLLRTTSCCGDANHLRPEDINIEEGFLDIRFHRKPDGTVIWRPKFGIERKVPIVETAAPFMASIRDLPTDKLGHVLGLHDRRKALDRAMAKAGITGNLRFHDFRHTAYTRLKEAALGVHDTSMALADMRLIFGHADKSMDRVYDHRTVERLGKLTSLMPLVEGVKRLLAA
jgi:integrase